MATLKRLASCKPLYLIKKGISSFGLHPFKLTLALQRYKYLTIPHPIRFLGMELITLHLPSEEEITFEIALVDEPAIESDYMVFTKEEQENEARYKFQEFDKSRKLLVGYSMIADLEIPRFDKTRGAYKVKFPKESIDKIVRNFSKNGLNKNLNEMHQSGERLDGVYVLWHWQVDEELGLKAPEGLPTEAEGSWITVVKCDNEEIYNKALKGEIKGFSIEGRFIEEEVFNKSIEKLFNELDELLKI